MYHRIHMCMVWGIMPDMEHLQHRAIAKVCCDGGMRDCKEM